MDKSYGHVYYVIRCKLYYYNNEDDDNFRRVFQSTSVQCHAQAGSDSGGSMHPDRSGRKGHSDSESESGVNDGG